MATLTFRQWLVRCDDCDKNWEEWEWSNRLPILCKSCNEPTYLFDPRYDRAPGLVTDGIPGGLDIRHLGPQPQRFYSKTDIKRACNEGGWVADGDTPKAYNVKWSGKRKNAPSNSST